MVSQKKNHLLLPEIGGDPAILALLLTVAACFCPVHNGRKLLQSLGK